MGFWSNLAAAAIQLLNFMFSQAAAAAAAADDALARELGAGCNL